jgi:WD40 repeat protein
MHAAQIDLTQSTSATLPFENAKQIRTLAVSPDGRLLVSIDEDGRALVVNRRRRALLHHFSFKAPVRAAAFSPDGAFLAVAVGRLVQVWRCPGAEKTVAPMQLHRTYGQCHADVTALDWSQDSCWVAAGSKDLTVRVFSMQPIEGYRPPTLSGHKEPPVAVHFTSGAVQEAAGLLGKQPPALYTLSRDGALHAWCYTKSEGAAAAPAGGAEEEEDDDEAGSSDSSSSGSDSDSGSDAEGGDEAAPRRKRRRSSSGGGGGGGGGGGAAAAEPHQSLTFAGGHWKLTDKFYFNQRGAKLTAAAFHGGAGLLAVGFSAGLFELLQLPDLATIHTLSIGRERISSLAFNAGGDWVAVGAAALGQLLVWEWRSESYVLKQQGHYYDVAATAFSPDGAHLVTGADDAKVKVWGLASGFCFVTFADHAAAVTAVAFAPSAHAVLSASLDGTVRAFDLVRYRNFRTLTTPTPVQVSFFFPAAFGLEFVFSGGGWPGCWIRLGAASICCLIWGVCGVPGSRGAPAPRPAPPLTPTPTPPHLTPPHPRPTLSPSPPTRAVHLPGHRPRRRHRGGRLPGHLPGVRLVAQDGPPAGRAGRPRGPRGVARLCSRRPAACLRLLGRHRPHLGRLLRQGRRRVAAPRARRAGAGLAPRRTPAGVGHAGRPDLLLGPDRGRARGHDLGAARHRGRPAALRPAHRGEHLLRPRLHLAGLLGRRRLPAGGRLLQVRVHVRRGRARDAAPLPGHPQPLAGRGAGHAQLQKHDG